jgi:hypothetical protein
LKKVGEYLKKVDTIGILQGMIRLVAWTSEGAIGAAKADKEWGLRSKYGYDLVIGDETNALANWLIEDEILPNLAIKTPVEAKVSDYINSDTSASYPNGIVMPGVVWYAQNGRMVFSWESKFDGTCAVPCGPGRPHPNDVWHHVVKRRECLAVGSSIMPSHGTNIRLCATEEEVNGQQHHYQKNDVDQNPFRQ